MIRILVMHSRDWLGSNPSFVERSIHEILKRIAAQGHYVAWLCGRRAALTRQRLGEVEVVDGIRLARLGPEFLHRPFARLFLDRLAKSGPCPFDIVLTCAAGQMVSVTSPLNVPVLPWVFSLTKRVTVLKNPAGPVLATTQRGASQLRALGVPPGHIVFVPVGVEVSRPAPFAQPSAKWMAVHGRLDHRRVFRTGSARFLRRLAALGLRAERAPVSSGLPWIAYCGAGHEWEALEYAAKGVPVVCPNTPTARECVFPEETGLLHDLGNWQDLEKQIRRLAEDEVLHKRLVEGGLKLAGQRHWDRSASLVLAAIENMLAEVS